MIEALFAGGHDCKGDWRTATDHRTNLPNRKYPLLISFPLTKTSSPLPAAALTIKIVDKIGQSLPHPPPPSQGLTPTKAERHLYPVPAHPQLSEVCKERTRRTQAVARVGRLQPFLSINLVNLNYYTGSG